MRTEVIIRATRTQNVLGECGMWVGVGGGGWGGEGGAPEPCLLPLVCV